MSQTGSVVVDQLDVPLEDAELLEEVEMTTNLIIAASEADETLSQGVVDRLLGVTVGSDESLTSAIPFQKVRRLGVPQPVEPG
jgi:hypothetical protein